MQVFRVDDMTCGRCASAITQAIKAADKDAQVTIDLAQRLVLVEPTATDAQALNKAITDAGYTPVPVQAPAVAAEKVKPGGCCGCRG